jgi:hypothetical protein
MVFVSVLSCNSDSVNETIESVVEDPYITITADGICEIDVPNYYSEIEDIHDDALIEYGYIQENDSVVATLEDEVYVIVLANYKNELDAVLGDSLEITINDFNLMCQQNLGNALSDFSVVNESPLINEDNEVKTIRNEFFGRLGEYLVYYQICIYETEMGYYQVLTWCMQEYMQKHKDEMIRITSSFKEL